MSHRRSTLGQPDSGGPSSGSNIPIPASAQKASSSAAAHGPPVSSQHSVLRASRASLAPSRSQGGPLSSQGAGERSMIGGSAAAGGGLGSSVGPGGGARGGAGGGGPGSSMRMYSEEALTTPRAGTSARGGGLGSSHMRQSTASGRQSLAIQSTPNQQRIFGRQSIAPFSFRAEAPAMKDPRPLRNAAFRAQMEAYIKEYVEGTGFRMPGWSYKTIHEPTQSAFVNMFKHIYLNCFDPNHVFGAEGKKFEEEVIMLMKENKYPFVDDLSKTRLTSAGSQQNWPICLGMLDWMIRLGTYAAEIGCGPLERDDPEDNDLFYRYLWRCYTKFWQGEDTFPEEYDELRSIYDQKLEANRAEDLALDKRLAELDAELAELEGESPVQYELRQAEVLQSDMAKFSKYNEEVLKPRLAKTNKQVEKLRQEQTDMAVQRVEKEKERDHLQSQVDAQEMSAEEYGRLTGEREHINKQLTETARSADTITRTNWALELDLQKRQAAVEVLITKFNDIGERVKFLPLTMRGGSSSAAAAADSGENEELDKLELVPGNEDTLLPKGLDIKRDIKPAIHGLRHATHAAFTSVENAKVGLGEQEENLLERLSTLRTDIRAEEARLSALKDQIDELTANSSVEMDMLAQDYARKERQLGAVESAGRLALQEANMTNEAMQDELETARAAIEENKQKMLSDVANAIAELDRLQQRTHEGIERIEEAVLAMDD
ncbi:hypothetical protein CF327_g6398 [Tilletia walkeri]|uniref:Kinetochore protein NDC80 n=1 Tax=Tilletia walkeri TaxID=117179 RepID=A0A8X7T3E0_9BASI|nr:hypothetical protein CF327_g6398 [Tilletia walkeri]KAE8228768.1 hypothetical protein CF326_g6292 [Tilletia indica]KAE8266668.1 hypothetical protein A4X09_0g5678 [Tilletia walkeri]